MSTDTTEAIRAILREHGRLAEDVATLCDQSDLFQAGLSSHASVTLMLALEGHDVVCGLGQRQQEHESYRTQEEIREGPRQ